MHMPNWYSYFVLNGKLPQLLKIVNTYVQHDVFSLNHDNLASTILVFEGFFSCTDNSLLLKNEFHSYWIQYWWFNIEHVWKDHFR